MGRRQAESRPCGSRGWWSSWHSALLFAASVLNACFLLSQAGMKYIPVVVDPPKPKERGNVTFTPQGAMGDSLTCRWHRGLCGPRYAIIYFYGPPYNAVNMLDEYTFRETISYPLCTLQIRNLTVNDSSTYCISLEKPGLMEIGVAELEVRRIRPSQPRASRRLTMGIVLGVILGCLAVVMVIVGMSDFWTRRRREVPASGPQQPQPPANTKSSAHCPHATTAGA